LTYHGHIKPLMGNDGFEYPSIAVYIYYCIEHFPPMPREEVISPLLKAGYTRKQAINLYHTYWNRYREWRFRYLESQGVVVDSVRPTSPQ